MLHKKKKNIYIIEKKINPLYRLYQGMESYFQVNDYVVMNV
jgi:hypothetical protein